MIEQALLVILGAAGASLLWMALLPAIAERARRLAQARTSLPANAAQAAAERDLLRAQQAVEIVRAERRVEAAETIAAKARAEVGRFAIDRAELAAMETRARESESEAGTAKILVADFAYQRERSASDLLEARRGVEERELAVDGLRTQLAAASARAGEKATPRTG